MIVPVLLIFAVAMPRWLQVLIWIGAAAGAITAVAALWTKVLRPLARLHASIERVTPPLLALTEVFGQHPIRAFTVLEEIAEQFGTNSGSTLRDSVDRLERAAEKSRLAGQQLMVQSEAAKILAEHDRQNQQRLLLMLDRLAIRVDLGGATVDRIEDAAKRVADDLAIAHERAAGVSGEPGAAADAAVVQPEVEP